MRQSGFTLLELMIALGISAVMAALATPSMQRLRANSATEAAARQVLAGAQLARRTALATGRSATLCLTSDDQLCGFGGTRWMLFTNGDDGSDSRREGAEPLIQTWPATRGIVVSGTRGYAGFQPQPRAATTVTFTFCYPGYADVMRSVVVSQTGRARISGPTSTAGRSECQ